MEIFEIIFLSITKYARKRRRRLTIAVFGPCPLSLFYQTLRWISDGKCIPNKLAYYMKLSYFYIIKIAKLYEISKLILVSIFIGNPPRRRMYQRLCEYAIQTYGNENIVPQPRQNSTSVEKCYVLHKKGKFQV